MKGPPPPVQAFHRALTTRLSAPPPRPVSSSVADPAQLSRVIRTPYLDARLEAYLAAHPPRVHTVYQPLDTMTLELWSWQAPPRPHRIRPVIAHAVAAYKALGCREPVCIHWIPLPHHKTLPLDGTALGTFEVNTGYTEVYPPAEGGARRIVIYRKEEAAKVLVHELIHFAAADERLWPDHEAASLERYITATYGIDSRLGIASREAFTDALALRFMGARLEWVLFQAAKVLLYYSRPHTLAGSSPWIEGTHVFSYYVLKAAALFSWREGPWTAAEARAALEAPAFHVALREAQARVLAARRPLQLTMCMGSPTGAALKRENKTKKTRSAATASRK